MIFITKTISIDESEIELHFVRSSGPGGQNVNKVASAVQLRFNAGLSASLPEDVRFRLSKMAGKRMSREGIIIIESRRFRTQEQNRKDAIARLIDLIRKSAVNPRQRKKTSPTKKAKELRLNAKRQRSAIKRNRKIVDSTE